MHNAAYLVQPCLLLLGSSIHQLHCMELDSALFKMHHSYAVHRSVRMVVQCLPPPPPPLLQWCFAEGRRLGREQWGRSTVWTHSLPRGGFKIILYAMPKVLFYFSRSRGRCFDALRLRLKKSQLPQRPQESYFHVVLMHPCRVALNGERYAPFTVHPVTGRRRGRRRAAAPTLVDLSHMLVEPPTRPK
eukprot:355478-Chlamydomonas_euryale.AAC.2